MDILTIIFLILCCSIAISCITMTGISIYNVNKDRISKETLFEIQVASANSKAMKDTLSVQDLYEIIDNMVLFYTSRQLISTNLANKSDQELSLIMDDIIETIATDVQFRLSDQFKKSWEVYFDPVEGNGSTISHLSLYIYNSTKTILIRSIESMKRQRSSGQKQSQPKVSNTEPSSSEKE